jgi:LIVCS family branched-chain amino acid:cation transporter
MAQVLFTLVFFAIVLFFSLKPQGIMTWIGTILNPLFLLLLGVLVLAVFLRPLNTVASVDPTAAYATGGTAFFSGFLEGYNTLDALAGLAFGIVVVNAVREHGVSQPARIAINTAKAGVFSCLFMGVIYWFVAMTAAQCGSVLTDSENGSEVLAIVANTYFRSAGTILLLAIVTLACLKTAIGLVTSCSEAFVRMFPRGPKYRTWAVLFCVVAFAIANFGLSTIVTLCVPVLMFLYPLSITLILLALLERWFGGAQCVYRWVTGFTLAAALFDLANALSPALASMHLPAVPLLDTLVGFAARWLPLFDYGLGWVCPALVGCGIGLVQRALQKAHTAA